MVRCSVRNCMYNEHAECYGVTEIVNGYCIRKHIDEDKCEECGEELVEAEENLEHFGTPCSQVFLRCPNGCLDV